MSTRPEHLDWASAVHLIARNTNDTDKARIAAWLFNDVCKTHTGPCSFFACLTKEAFKVLCQEAAGILVHKTWPHVEEEVDL